MIGSLRSWNGFIITCKGEQGGSVSGASFGACASILRGKTHLDDELPNVKEEVSDPVVVLVLVEDEEL